jgi:hypothetical protein
MKHIIIHINHVGFLPHAVKSLVVSGPPQDFFNLYRLSDTKFTLVFTGPLQRRATELGEGLVGDFSAWNEEGIYRIECGDAVSHCFVIGNDVYRYPASMLLNFFRSQRCGDSETGWASPCHLDDQIVLSTGECRDLTGGYHQSCDLRKWPWGISLALVGLAEAALEGGNGKTREALLSEIRWGGDYLRKLQRNDGGLIDCTLVPEGFEGRAPGEVRGFEDPHALWGAREFYESDAPAPAQWQAIRFHALAFGIFQRSEPDLAKVCLEAARKGWAYMTRANRDFTAYQAPEIPPLGHEGLNIAFSGFYRDSAHETAHRLCAALSLHRATGETCFLEDATNCARVLCALQLDEEVTADRPDGACFRESTESPVLADSFLYFWRTSGPLGLVELLRLAPEHPDASTWRKAVRAVAEQYRWVAQKNVYGRFAAAWFREGANPFESPAFFTHASEEHKGSDGKYFFEDREKAGRIFYKYYNFCYNVDIMAGAVFLGKAALYFKEPAYAALAQRTLDWILGCNPFNASSVEGVGYNQPHRGLFGEFFPPVPQMPGAVFVGIDENSFDPKGQGLSNEYDLPMGGWLAWLFRSLERPLEQLRNP